ncbi:zinc finger protein 233 [Trichonephila clavipes]|nr:zinc finger protein 233 [Trichonephila clavipes]
MAFTQENSRHHLHVHDDKKPYICEICNKGFSKTGRLKEHSWTHTNEKPYVCEMCSKGFSRNGNLKRHLRIHTEEKPYACEMCNSRFSQTCHLKAHLCILAKEKPYVCEICKKGFSYPSNLKTHLLIHTTEKPYVCEMCSKSFTRNGDLKRHLRIHTKEKPYVCEMCNKGFSQPDGDRFNSCPVIYSQFGLAIHQNDHQARRRFVEWAQNEIAVVPDFHKRILFSDEAHFWLNGYVNKQNCRIWSEANPQVYVETPLHPEKLTVWCALWAGGILLQKR